LTTVDGLRLAFNDGWLLIRPSGTEPKIRITAEAKNEGRTKELYNFGLKVIRDAVRGEPVEP
jgi:phosphomannomutase